MLVRDFDFELSPDLIAQDAPRDRAASRLMRLNRDSGALDHLMFLQLQDCLRAGDLLVVNDTRVFPARLLGQRDPSGGAVECLLMERLDPPPDAPGRPATELWDALMHPGQKLRPGARVLFEGRATLYGEVIERRFHGRRVIRLWTADGAMPVADAVDAIGHVPLPPYIDRIDRPDDRERYQTVYAQRRGSVAAPTAGLHFTDGLLDALRQRDIEVAALTLHVGYGTFQPVRVEEVARHEVAPERYDIPEATAVAVNRAIDERRRVIAVGTTTTRTLEGVALANAGRVVPGRGAIDLFIYPGFEFRVIRALVTNFHLPRSSLLMLVAAFAGRERVLAAYRSAIANGYRFYSYGDAMLID
jgi:S-adenosylmethionine:tRNA ribosyltransferase-isomerase